MLFGFGVGEELVLPYTSVPAACNCLEFIAFDCGMNVCFRYTGFKGCLLSDIIPHGSVVCMRYVHILITVAFQETYKKDLTRILNSNHFLDLLHLSFQYAEKNSKTGKLINILNVLNVSNICAYQKTRARSK